MGLRSVLRRADQAVEDTKQSIGFAVVAAAAAIVATVVTLVILVATR